MTAFGLSLEIPLCVGACVSDGIPCRYWSKSRSRNRALWSLSMKWKRGRIPAALIYWLRSAEVRMKSMRVDPWSTLAGCAAGPWRRVIGSVSSIVCIHFANLLLCLVSDSFASMRTMIPWPLFRFFVISVPRSANIKCLGSFGDVPLFAEIMYCCRNAVFTPAVANFWSHTL